MTFQNFFQTATGNTPYAWQERLAEESCASQLIKTDEPRPRVDYNKIPLHQSD